MDKRVCHRVSVACGLVLGLSLALPGCKAVRKWFPPADEIEIAQEQATATPDAVGREGLGVRLLVVDDTDYDAPRALRGYPGLRDESVRSRWARWGFRIVEVPVGDVDAILGSLRPVQPISVQFMGEFGHWRPLVRSGEIRQSSVLVGDVARPIEQGRPRIIARAWMEPRLIEGGVDDVLRVDLGMQIEKRAQSGYRLLPEDRQQTLDDEGPVLDELLSTLRLDGRTALVIVGEAPNEDWSELPEPSRELAVLSDPSEPVGPEAEDSPAQEGADEQAEAPQPFEPQASSRSTIEPQAPRARALGELMLVAPGSRLIRANETRTIPKRVVIVLTPEDGDDDARTAVTGRGGAS